MTYSDSQLEYANALVFTVIHVLCGVIWCGVQNTKQTEVQSRHPLYELLCRYSRYASQLRDVREQLDSEIAQSHSIVDLDGPLRADAQALWTLERREVSVEVCSLNTLTHHWSLVLSPTNSHTTHDLSFTCILFLAIY